MGLMAGTVGDEELTEDEIVVLERVALVAKTEVEDGVLEGMTVLLVVEIMLELKEVCEDVELELTRAEERTLLEELDDGADEDDTNPLSVPFWI